MDALRNLFSYSTVENEPSPVVVESYNEVTQTVKELGDLILTATEETDRRNREDTEERVARLSAKYHPNQD